MMMNGEERNYRARKKKEKKKSKTLYSEKRVRSRRGDTMSHGSSM